MAGRMQRMQRMQSVTPFNDSMGPSDRHAVPEDPKNRDPKRIKVKTNMSRAFMSGDDDPLHAALAARVPVLPSDNHEYRPGSRVHPRGVSYSPAGEFGHRSRTGVGSTRQIYGGNRHSAPSANAVGSPTHHGGGNAVPGHQNTRRGQNAVGSPPNRPNRRGQNAVGNPPNRYGENALAGSFRPRFGRPHGHRA
jgi:hypothetical protein